MKITADGEKLLVGDLEGHLRLISSRDGEVIKCFGRVSGYYISGIMISADEKFFFVSSSVGVLKQWN
jgi:hypothetical protein